LEAMAKPTAYGHLANAAEDVEDDILTRQ
jgi:hypothetical protein